MLPPIRVLIFPDHGRWVAQCLEYDIAAQAGDPRTARSRVNAAIVRDLHESLRRTGRPFGGIAPAPRAFHELWRQSSDGRS